MRRPPRQGARDEARHRALGSDASACLAVGTGVADFEDLDLLDAGGGAELDGVTLVRLEQCAGDWGHPAHLTAREIGFVDADDRDRGFASVRGGVGDGRAEEHLVAPLLLSRVDDLGSFQPLRQEADATIG